jgi:hypothetical protein
MAGVNDSAKQVLGRIADVWQIDTGRVRWTTREGQDALGFDWWSGDFCVGARAQIPREANPDSECRLVIRTKALAAPAACQTSSLES